MDNIKENLDESIRENTALEEKNVTLELNVSKLTKKLHGLTKDLEETTSENRSLRKKVDVLEVVTKAPAVPERIALSSIQALPDPVVLANLVLGELCWQIQGMMYQRVLPDFYDSMRSYKIKHIDQDIEDLLENEQQKIKARKI